MTSPRPRLALTILLGIGFCHLVNDLLQALLPAIYPLLKTEFHLDFWQIGMITLSNQVTASLLQPFVGHYTDRRPQPYSLAAGMTCTLGGILLLAVADRFALILAAAALVGIGSSVFHPESSRIARLASGGRHGFAQSLFQTGGNAGSALGPLLAAFIVVPRGQRSLAWFSIAAVTGIAVLARVGRWYASIRAGAQTQVNAAAPRAGEGTGLAPQEVRRALLILGALVFSKFVYMTSLTSYYTFYLIERFHVSVTSAQLHLFVFLAAVAAGTFLGGPIGDRFGRKRVIWGSILGVLPFSLALPYASLAWTGVLTVAIGLVISSAFSAILVYGQELVPGRVGLVAGLFFGLAFGIGGLSAAGLGHLADATNIEVVYRVTAFLPAIGLLTAWLPDTPRGRRA